MRLRQARFDACFLRFTITLGRYFGVLRSLWIGLLFIGDFLLFNPAFSIAFSAKSAFIEGVLEFPSLGFDAPFGVSVTQHIL